MGDTDALRDKIAQAIRTARLATYGFEGHVVIHPKVAAEAVLPVVTQEVEALGDENEKLRRKIDMPCGDCHPCDNYADETWRREGKRPPAVITWQDTLAAKRELAQALSLLRSRVEALADELDKEATLTIHPETARSFPTSYVAHLGRRGGLRDAAQRIRRSLSDNKEQQ